MIHLYHGEGKGKTTAAAGLALRFAGHGKPVIFVQFLKDGTSGELHAFKELPNVKVLTGKTTGFCCSMEMEEKMAFAGEQEELFKQILREIEGMEEGLVVLDEVTYVYNWDMILKKELEELLAAIAGEKGERIELVMTGRDPDEKLKQYADYITEMKSEKHPYEKGVLAREGVEF